MTASGPVRGGSVVSITGIFPDEAFVWFGDQPGDVLYQSRSWILTVAPAAGRSGPVDVGISTVFEGTVLMLTDGFTYRDPTGGGSGGGSGTTTTTAVGQTPTTSDAGNRTTTTARSSTTISSRTTVSSTTGANPPTTTRSSSPTTTPSTSPTTSFPDDDTTSSTATPGGPGDTTSSTATPGGPDDTTGQDGDSPDPTTPEPSNRRTRAVTSGEAVDLPNGLRGRRLPDLTGLRDVPVCSSDPCRIRQI